MLLMADRGFPSYDVCGAVAATGARLLWRVSESFTLPLVDVLPDGTYLSLSYLPSVGLWRSLVRSSGPGALGMAVSL
ncbi:hypothetical protein ABH925_007413 [Streptacidiphilus sp. EB129]